VSADWLEINQGDVDAQEVARQVRERLSRRDRSPPGGEDPLAVARSLWEERIGPLVHGADLDGAPADDRPTGAAPADWISMWQDDCDLVPRNYTIDWRTPIMGPIHAAIRRIVNAEIRRYLLPALEKQSFLNRKVLQMLDDLAHEQDSLARENARLREEIERLRGGEV
jgi:hypothetical protein